MNKAAVEGGRHADLTWGAAQAGLAGGIADALAEGVLLAADAPRSALIAAVWVSPKATDADAVYRNNREATLVALRNGAAGNPTVAEVVAAREWPWNPFYASGT